MLPQQPICCKQNIGHETHLEIIQKPLAMKFKINYCRETKHKNILSCLDWAKNDEVYTIGYLFYWFCLCMLLMHIFAFQR